MIKVEIKESGYRRSVNKGNKLTIVNGLTNFTREIIIASLSASSWSKGK